MSVKLSVIVDIMYHKSSFVNMTLFVYYPLDRDPAHSAEECNTAAPELHFRPAVARSTSTLDAFPGSAHPTPLAKLSASPHTNSHHPPDDFRHVCFFLFICTLLPLCLF